jgi:hypothetical protein
MVSRLTFEQFQQSLRGNSGCPTSLHPALQALWYDRQGNWTLAHQIVQDESDLASTWVHAYLHRREGDLSNAHYWYRRSGRSLSEVSLDREWEEITRSLLS